ncbi:uncharacterized protein N0V89_010972 [Didymosphaeria variabile]|uniref:CBF1-interacting co-repressor CIR N-terminal domain-containing protein n=1 Tax=Didymosphaeria variabile TaxID=1932322 RepID=A0A9W8XCS4_9PLEO|nr:uncharacterized protein N0V89_010972 [Didymosphaeria variabile]KAJ4347038.1 hypothetical protein N0V89_010972 [Didymosphaeria variabile]
MPLHLLGKKSWNVYNADNIARVKADEAAAAAQEAAEEQRIQEIDAAQRAAILRGRTPPPLRDEERLHTDETRKAARKDGHERKRRKLAGEDDTDRDIRLAISIRGSGGDGAEDSDTHLVKLRKPTSDAPLIDHAGNINLFPVDVREQRKREKNEEAEREKRKKERALEDQYRMRFSNAAGRGGLEKQPWYASRSSKNSPDDESEEKATAFPDLEDKTVWGNKDPLRRQRELARRASNDPFALMQRAQVQLKKSKGDKKRWAAERDRELMELRAAQERYSRREKHGKRRKRVDDEHDDRVDREARDGGRSSSRGHRRERKRSRSGDEDGRHRDHIDHPIRHRREPRTSDREDR